MGARPGPWKWSIEGSSRTSIVSDADGVPILRFYADRASDADKNLTAASPELRDALKRCTELLASATGLPPKEVATALAAANAALAKAEFGR
jgi:hypothetical protein